MNEPLNHPGRASWPEWHSQPLRLTAVEIHYPLHVFEEFFQCYHLPDIRTCLHNWLQDSLGRESADNKQHYETHQLVEKLVEASWLVYKKSRAEKISQLTTTDVVTEEAAPNAVDTVFEVYQKDPRLIELAHTDPLRAIKEVFFQEELLVTKENLTKWVHMALSTEWCDYTEADHRVQLLEFYKELLPFIEAMYVIGQRTTSPKQSGPADSPQPPQAYYNTPVLLSQELLANPEPVIYDFLERFPAVYIQRELWEWLYAGLSHLDELSDRLPGLDILSTYDRVLCLIESARQLIKQGMLSGSNMTTA